MPNDNLFSQTYDQIVSGALGGGKQYFQMLGNPQSFVFGIPPARQTNAQAYQIVSGMPLWSPIGNFAYADAKFANAYKQVFQNITWKVSPAQEQAQKDLQSTVNQKGQDLTNAQTAVNSNYQLQLQNGGPVFQAQYSDIQTWLAGPGATYMKAVAAAQQAYNEAVAQLTAMQKAAMPDTLQEAMAALTPPDGDPASSKIPPGWTIVADASGALQWQPAFNIGTTGEDFRAKLSTGTIGSFEVDINASDSTSNLTKSWAGASAGYDAFFWGVSGSGGWEQLDISDDDKSLRATIKVKSSTLVNVTPGDWYDGGFMKQLAKGSGPGGTGWQINPPWQATGSSNALFGKGGLLSTRVSGLLVVYQPSFEITMSEATYQRNYKKIDAGGGLRIGPFHFGGHGGHESDYQHSTNNKDTFTGGSTSTDPLIIGATVAFPGVDTP